MIKKNKSKQKTKIDRDLDNIGFNGRLSNPTYRLVRVRFSSLGALTSDGAGKIIVSQGSYSNLNSSGSGTIPLTSATQYSSYNARFQEFRVLAVKLTFSPRVVIQDGTHAVSGLMMFPFQLPNPGGTLTAASSYSGAYGFAGSQIHPIVKARSMTVKAKDLEDLQFLPWGSTPPQFGISLYADSLTASTIYGELGIEWLVEMRGAL